MTTKQYLRFEPSSVFGVIGSSTAKILHVEQNNKLNYVAVPACENVIVWSMQTKEKTLVFHGETSYVTCLINDGNYQHIAVGYADGFIRIFEVKSGGCIVSFCGHKSSVACLAYDEENLHLASGGKDSEIVLWNVFDETGLLRLRGHKGSITECRFFKQKSTLISSSMDTFIKFWDLSTGHCFRTIISRHEILDFIILKDSRIITGVKAADLRVWDILDKDATIEESIKKIRLDESEGINEKTVDEDENSDEKSKCVEVGAILTSGDKTVGLVIEKSERLFGCHASTKVLNLYKILNYEEIAKKLRKRKRKASKIREEGHEEVSDVSEIVVADEFQILKPIETKGKIDSFSLTLKEDIAKITVLLKNNSIYQYQLDISNKNNVAELCSRLEISGHRGTIRSLNYSSDSLSIMSVSDESIKIWKRIREEEVCMQTLECDSGLCSVFASGNNHCIIGTKNGTLAIYNVNSQELLETVQSHAGSVNCLCESPDQLGVTSGSKDNTIKFWDFELLQDERKRLTLSLKRTLKMPEEVICLRYSPNKSRLAAALHDNTVQVLTVDSLKLVFSLYGHLLPVTCMDISYDSTIIVTASEDKDIRIWSMEFGDCSKLIKNAHDKGITCLYFLPKTHMFFTGGRDNAVKQWDADNFAKIVTLKGHQNEVNAMAVSPDGVTVITASRDRSIRIWEKTEEPLVLEEEQEMEMEDEIETDDLPTIPGEVNKEVALAGLKTVGTIKTVEQLIESVDIYKHEVLKLQEYKVECQKAGKELPLPTPHPLFIAYSASTPINYMQKVVNKIKPSEVKGSLVLLPFSYALDFLKILCEFADRGWEIEFCVRCSAFLMRIHMGHMLSSPSFRPIIERLKEKLFKEVKEIRNDINFVKTACVLQQRAIDAVEEVPMFTKVLDGLQSKKKKSKKKLEHPIVAFT